MNQLLKCYFTESTSFTMSITLKIECEIKVTKNSTGLGEYWLFLTLTIEFFSSNVKHSTTISYKFWTIMIQPYRSLVRIFIKKYFDTVFDLLKKVLLPASSMKVAASNPFLYRQVIVLLLFLILHIFIVENWYTENVIVVVKIQIQLLFCCMLDSCLLKFPALDQNDYLY